MVIKPKSSYQDYGYTSNQPIHSNNYLLKSIVPLLDQKRNTCILDLGCGNGSVASELIRLGYNVFGTDASETGIEHARQQYPDRFFCRIYRPTTCPMD